MILIVCESCQLCLRVMGSREEVQSLVGEDSSFWPDQYPCPRCEKLIYAVRELEADPRIFGLLTLVDVNAGEAFAALNGMGLPEEGDCRRGVLEDLLRTHPVKKLSGKDIPGTNRCRVDFIELWDNTRLYFAAGAEGAVVYRVVRPRSYVEKIDGG